MANQITDEDLILVTGASGYIACWIVKQLLEKGYRVRGTVRSLKDEKKLSPLRKLAESPRHPLELVEADLDKEEGWNNAVKGCTYVVHTASPFPASTPKDENELIKPAVNGTLFVLKACVAPGNKVKRVVLTSSIAAVTGSSYIHNKTYTENDWPDTRLHIHAYYKSKYLAEKAAWDFVNDRITSNLPCFELTVINPGAVFGPLLHNTISTTAEYIKRLLLNETPVIPDIYLPSCDVRDVATAHVRALTLPDVVNKRHIIVSETISYRDMALWLNAEFKNKNYKVPTSSGPNCLFRVLALCSADVKTFVHFLSIYTKYDTTRLRNVLNIQPIPTKKSVIEMAYSMIDRGLVPKKY